MLLALLQADGPTWSVFWGLISAVTLSVMAIGAWAIRSLLSHRERTMLALATGESKVDLKLLEHRRDLELRMAEMHSENVAKLAEMAAALKEIAALLYGARGHAGHVEELAYNSDVRHGIMEHLQALEFWALAASEVEGMPEFTQPRPVERRRRAPMRESDG